MSLRLVLFDNPLFQQNDTVLWSQIHLNADWLIFGQDLYDLLIALLPAEALEEEMIFALSGAPH